MNLDGGGSSTVYYNGSVINYPHCQDIPDVWCQRPISVITCIKE
jgi:exopolysaccharide biosynthesis protein